MESSDGLDGDIAVDGSVGTIVWVRRRNGSWWPGRILGPDELSASHLMSPRSGTPVKLLGRDDASVDWYNLEKSKRVKAFRCGEFDACIERAEASQGIPIKKREKYARREDAILHALELEMEQNKLGKIASGISNKTSSASKRELSNVYSEVHMRNDEPCDHRKFASHKPPTVSRKGALSHEEDNDFGLRIAPSNRTLSQSVTWETSREHGDAHVDVLSSVDHVMGGASHAGSRKHPLSIKRKMSPGSMVEESICRKRDRHRPLVQVLQSSTKLPVSPSFQSDYDGGVISMQGEKDHMGAVCRAKRSRCIYLPADSNDSLDISGYHSEETAITATHFGMDDHLHHPASFAEEYTSSGLMEATESDSSERDFWEADMVDGENLLTDTSPDLIPGPKDCFPLEYQIPDKSGNIENDVMPLSNHLLQSPLHEHYADASAEAGVSKWHMKGKRNIRNLAKRSIIAMDGKVSLSSAHKSIGSSKGTTPKSKGSSFRMGRAETSSQRTLARGLYHRKYFNHASDRGDLTDKDLSHARLTGYGNRRYPFPSESAKDRGRSHISLNGSDNESELMSQSGWEADGPSHAARRAYWGESDECFDPINDEMGPMLVDVDLKVQTSYQGEHVPLVSLMSRLNGKAIIGHPVQIEILGDDSAGHLVVSRNDTGLNERTPPPPVWRTARRTAMQRVPRSNPVTSAMESEDAEPLHCSDLESKPPFTKSYSGHFNHQAKLAKKSISHTLSPVSGKSQKKLLKRVSLSSQKTRTLSSIATDQKLRGEKFAQLPKGGSILGGLIKPEGGVPIVTCVPVKVAFSRILEAVGRPSAAVAHRVQATCPAVKDPSRA